MEGVGKSKPKGTDLHLGLDCQMPSHSCFSGQTDF